MNNELVDKNKLKTKRPGVYLIVTIILSFIFIVIGLLTQVILLTGIGIGIFVATIYLFLSEYLGKKAGSRVSIIHEEVLTSKDDIKIPLNIPLPYAIFGNDKRISLYNDKFQEIFPDLNTQNISLFEIIDNFDESLNIQRIEKGNKYFDAITSKIEVPNDVGEGKSDVYSICFVDVTENSMIKKRINDGLTVMAFVFIDNYEDVTQSIEDTSVPILMALIDQKLNSLAEKVGGVIKKFEKDRYIFILSNKMLENIKEKKFEILTEVKEVSIGDHIPMTLSIGVGISDISLGMSMKSAKAAVDLALGRGGDQALIKDGEKYLFYGGKSGESSRNARIRARVKADALSELIIDSTEVFVMGHKHADIDSLGSAIGIYRISKSLGKKCSVVLDEFSSTTKSICDRIGAMEDYKDIFIKSEDAINILSVHSLVIIVDTHRSHMVESVELLEKAQKVVVFDHHRKSTDFINHAVLIYHEPYASSTSEMITEMIQHMGEQVKLKPVEADALLGGISVDTKKFTQKTGAITFEAAAFLRRNGADTTRVRKFFQSDMESCKAKATAIKNAQIYRDGIILTVCPLVYENTIVTAAQTADDLLSISEVKASFVLCQISETVFVSGRSMGEINVQVILEKLGGGGHQTISGAQLIGTEITQAKEVLKRAIDEYLEEV